TTSGTSATRAKAQGGSPRAPGEVRQHLGANLVGLRHPAGRREQGPPGRQPAGCRLPGHPLAAHLACAGCAAGASAVWRARRSVESFGMTGIGRVRPRNEDQFLIAELTRAMELKHSSLDQPSTLLGTERAQLLLVADGMGGHAAGETASELAVLTVEAVMLN